MTSISQDISNPFCSFYTCIFDATALSTFPMIKKTYHTHYIIFAGLTHCSPKDELELSLLLSCNPLFTLESDTAQIKTGFYPLFMDELYQILNNNVLHEHQIRICYFLCLTKNTSSGFTHFHPQIIFKWHLMFFNVCNFNTKGGNIK